MGCVPTFPKPVGEFNPESGDWTLTQDWEAETRYGLLRMTAGFHSDGNSIPRMLWTAVGPRYAPDTFAPGLAHDGLYAAELPQRGGWRRAEADAIFRDMLAAQGVGFLKRNSYWAGVRLFGWRSLPGHTPESVADARKLVFLQGAQGVGVKFNHSIGSRGMSENSWVGKLIGYVLARIALWCLVTLETMGIDPQLEEDLAGDRRRALEKRAAKKEFHPFAWLVGRLLGNRVLYALAIQTYTNPSANLNGPENDLDLVWSRAKSRGYKAHWLKNLAATRSEILAFFRAAVADAKNGKRVRVWTSGHGTRLRDRNGDEADGWDGAIVSGRMEAVLDDDIGEILSRLESKDDFALVGDNCYFGEMPRGLPAGDSGSRIRSVQQELVDFRASLPLRRVRRKPRSVEAAGVLAACRDNEYSMESKIGSKVYGAFTYYAMMMLSGSESLSTVRARAAKALKANGYTQQPVVFGNSKLPLL